MFPLGVAGKSSYRAYVTFGIIALNVLAFVVMLASFFQGEEAVLRILGAYALDVCLIGQESIFTTLQKGLSSLFLHASVAHILGNMTILWVFAPRVEAYFGHKRFLMFYILAGLVAHVAHALFGSTACQINPLGYVVGASGAIAGVMGAFLFLHPSARVRTALMIRLPLLGSVPFKTIHLSAWLYLSYWFILDLIQGIGWIASAGVAHWAHIGGFVGGFAIVFVATLFKPAPQSDPFNYLDD